MHGGSVRARPALALPPVDDAQARHLDRPVRHLRLRRLRPLHHLVPGRRSTSPRRPPRSARRPAGGDRCRRSTSCSPRRRRFARPGAEHLDADRRLRAQPRASRRRRSCSARASRPTRSTSSATARSRSRPTCPSAARSRSRRCTTATCSAGRGWSRRYRWRCSTRARSAASHAIAFDGACLRGKCERGPALGYDLLQALRRRSWSSACRRRGSGCSTSTARSASLSAREAGRWCRRPSGSRDRRQETARHVDARARARATRRSSRSRPGQFAMLYAFGVGEVPISISGDLGRRDSCTPSAPSAPSRAALCDAPPRRRARRARPVRHGVAGRRRPRAPTWWSSPAGIGLAPLRPVVARAARAPRALRRASSLLYGGRTPGRAALPRRARALARARRSTSR